MSERILDAINLATRLHKGQLRKGSGEAYVGHPLAVSYLVMKYKGRSKAFEDLIIAAILHDVVEDANYPSWKISKEFGGRVAGLVQELTTDEEAKIAVGKKVYLKTKMSGMSSYALVIKLCDRLHNMSDCPSKQAEEDTLEILAHIEAKRTLSNTHRAIIADIREMIWSRM